METGEKSLMITALRKQKRPVKAKPTVGFLFCRSSVVRRCCGWYPAADKALDSFWQLRCYIHDLVNSLAGDSADR